MVVVLYILFNLMDKTLVFNVYVAPFYIKCACWTCSVLTSQSWLAEWSKCKQIPPPTTGLNESDIRMQAIYSIIIYVSHNTQCKGNVLTICKMENEHSTYTTLYVLCSICMLSIFPFIAYGLYLHTLYTLFYFHFLTPLFLS